MAGFRGRSGDLLPDTGPRIPSSLTCTSFATAAAVWGAALLAIYLVYRSVIPLILGHFIFDLLIGNSQWSSTTTTWTLVLGGIAVATTYVLECRTSRP